jgi:hypothetical protein
MESLKYTAPPPLKGRPLPESLSVEVLACSHKIHRQCLRSLLEAGTETCPYCRSPINSSNDRFGFKEEEDDECIMKNSLEASQKIVELVSEMELVGFNTIGFTKPTMTKYNLRNRLDELQTWSSERTGQPKGEVIMNTDQCRDITSKVEQQLRWALQWNSVNSLLTSTMAEVELMVQERSNQLVTSASNTKSAILSDYGIITKRTLAMVTQTRDIQRELHKAHKEIRMRNGRSYIEHHQGLHLLTAEILLDKFNHYPSGTPERG